MEKRSRRGRVFYGCSAYPKCNFAIWERPVDVRCPKCNGLMSEKAGRSKSRYRKCLNKECGHTVPLEDREPALAA